MYYMLSAFAHNGICQKDARAELTWTTTDKALHDKVAARYLGDIPYMYMSIAFLLYSLHLNGKLVSFFR